jgi:hypothetical protein
VFLFGVFRVVDLVEVDFEEVLFLLPPDVVFLAAISYHLYTLRNPSTKSGGEEF